MLKKSGRNSGYKTLNTCNKKAFGLRTEGFFII